MLLPGLPAGSLRTTGREGGGNYGEDVGWWVARKAAQKETSFHPDAHSQIAIFVLALFRNEASRCDFIVMSRPQAALCRGDLVFICISILQAAD